MVIESRGFDGRSWRRVREGLDALAPEVQNETGMPL
jgi:hypothetical protein